MEIKYIGHSCFRIKGKDTVAVTDPFESKSVGLPMAKLGADIVTVSHDHTDHNKAELVDGTPRRSKPMVVRETGEYEVGGMCVIGTEVFHDEENGAARGKNIVFTFLVDGLIVCHLGDLGHKLSDDQVEDIGQVDILLVPVGGVFTLGPAKAVEVVEQLSPSIVIPMHYKREGMSGEFESLSTVDEFVTKVGLGQAKRAESLKLSKDELPEDTELYILEG